MFVGIVRALTGADRALPGYVQEVVSAASFTLRPGTDEDTPRIVCVLAGGGLRGAFVYDREEAARRVSRRWPELTPDQQRRAVDQIEAGAMRAARPSREQQRKRNFVNRFSD